MRIVSCLLHVLVRPELRGADLLDMYMSEEYDTAPDAPSDWILLAQAMQESPRAPRSPHAAAAVLSAAAEVVEVTSLDYSSPRNLDWRERNISIHALGAIASALTANVLIEVRLSHDLTSKQKKMLITDDGAAVLGQALPHALTLQVLNLRGNHIGPQGFSALVAGIVPDAHLRVLDLGDNALGDLGAMRAALWLSSGRAPVRELCLDANIVNDMGVRAIAHALPRAAKLQELNLRKNAFGNDGVMALAAALAAVATANDDGAVCRRLRLGDNLCITDAAGVAALRAAVVTARYDVAALELGEFGNVEEWS
jgi:Ran GTPase-activating protein (RanGAP) involved in mRNA processing and transport